MFSRENKMINTDHTEQSEQSEQLSQINQLFPEIEMNAFMYQNLARKSWVDCASPKLKSYFKSIEREARFVIYDELDKHVMDKVIEISKQKRNQNIKFVYEQLFTEAAKIIIEQYEQELLK